MKEAREHAENLRMVREKIETALDTLAGPQHALDNGAVSRAKTDLAVALIHLRKAIHFLAS